MPEKKTQLLEYRQKRAEWERKYQQKKKNEKGRDSLKYDKTDKISQIPNRYVDNLSKPEERQKLINNTAVIHNDWRGNSTTNYQILGETSSNPEQESGRWTNAERQRKYWAKNS